ncbi:Proteinase inhibitor [Bienertia sinuspersici]
MSSGCPGKNLWPELVGEKGKKAAKIIRRENPNVVRTAVLLYGTFVTLDFRCDRVWVWVDDDGYVVQAPMIG